MVGRKVGIGGSHGVRALVAVISVIVLILLGAATPGGAAKKPELPPRLGFVYRVLYPELAEDLGVPKTTAGIVALWLNQGSPAELAGLNPGDVIVKVQRQKAKPLAVPDLTRFEAALKNLRADQDVTFYVLRGGKETPITLRPSTSQFGPPVQPHANPAPVTLKAVADGSGDARTLQGALLKARPGDTVLVGGTQASASAWMIGLTIAPLQGSAAAEVGGLEVVGAKGVKIRGLTFATDPKAPQSFIGLNLQEVSDVTVEDCTVRGFLLGVRVAASEGVVLLGSTITQNSAGIGVKSSTVKISRNLVLRNSSDARDSNYSGGITIEGGSAEVTQNTVLDNQVSPERFQALMGQYGAGGVGIWIWDGTTAVVANNLVLGNNIGIMVGAKAQATVEYNDVWNHVIQAGLWTRGNNEYHLQGSPSNFLTQISYQYKPQPVFPLINFEPDRHYYTPVLQFQPSQTNLGLDPLFADRLKGDYRLALDSPLIGRGRGGTYIGAFPPVVPIPPTSPARGGAADSRADASPVPKPATQGGALRAWVQGNALFVQAEAVDSVWGRLHKRLADNPPNLERVKSGPIGVVPLAFTGAEGIALSPSLSEDMTTAMINSGLTPADPGSVKKAMADLAVKDSGELDQNLIRELGRKTNCRVLLVGSVSDRGPVVVLTVRLIEAETGQYLAAERLEVAKVTN